MKQKLKLVKKPPQNENARILEELDFSKESTLKEELLAKIVQEYYPAENALTDDDLLMVNAAGSPEVEAEKKKKS